MNSNKKKYVKRDKNKPAFIFYYKSKKNNMYDLNIDKNIIENPLNSYWNSLADRMKLDVHTCYTNFLQKYFKKQNPNLKDINKKLSNLKDSEESWLSIGFKLNMNPIDCIKRCYQLEITKAFWSKEEDAQLIDLVLKFGKNWVYISSLFNNRSRTQCLQRYKKLIVSNKKGRWSIEEDEVLKEAVEKYIEKGWSFISQYVPNRSDSQCRERWMYGLNLCLKKGKWTNNEDEKLKELVALYGESWAKISSAFGERNSKQCKRRYKLLTKK